MKLATLCYIKSDGKTLMLHRNKRAGDIHGGKWNGLGGKIRLGETPEECVIREVKEESGLTIQNPSLRGVLTFPAFKEEEDWYVYVFLVTEIVGASHDLPLRFNSPEGELKWIEDALICDLPLWEGDPIFLKWLEEGRFFSGKFIYRDGQFISYDVVFHDWQRPPMPPQECFRKGIELFNNEEFYESHEVLEDLWRETEDEYKNLYKGIIQAAVALHHLKKGNVNGAGKVFRTSIAYLAEYKPKALGLDIDKLIQDLEICFKEDSSLVPKLDLPF